MADEQDAAILVCGEEDPRIKPWINRLLPTFGTVYSLYSANGRRRYVASDKSGTEVRFDNLPKSVAAIVMHSSERHLWDGRPHSEVVFVFTEDGWPPVHEGELPIYRKTIPFQFDRRDADEMASFARGQRSELPSFCVPVGGAAEKLQAIGVLCQGFLAVHARLDGRPDLSPSDYAYESIDSALAEMSAQDLVKGGGSSRTLSFLGGMSPETRSRLRFEVTKSSWWSVLATNELEKEAEVEWGVGNVNGWLDVQRLLCQVRMETDIHGETVARAYSALVKRLRTVGSS